MRFPEHASRDSAHSEPRQRGAFLWLAIAGQLRMALTAGRFARDICQTSGIELETRQGEVARPIKIIFGNRPSLGGITSSLHGGVYPLSCAPLTAR
jgi:hypothetical protein